MENWFSLLGENHALEALSLLIQFVIIYVGLFMIERYVFLEKGMNVIVDTAMGEEYGEVAIPYKEMDDENVTEPLKKVIRIVTDKDRKMYSIGQHFMPQQPIT